ncbi:MAG: methionine synthase [Candidatus Omnitrophota bacterium]
MMPDLRGLATGIGSLPYKEPKDALDLIFKYLPEIPFWPQLPRRSFMEGMVAQYSQNIPCLSIAGDELIFRSKNIDDDLEKFYEKIISRDLEYFAIGADHALGLYEFRKALRNEPKFLEQAKYIKCHITGPFTFSASVIDDKGLALLHDPVLRQAIIKGLAMKALWQVNFLKEFNKDIIMFIDEPYLASFGSAYTPITREDVVKGLTELATDLKSENVLTGVHCCGNTDWSIFTDIGPLDMINFDAYNFMDKFVLYADDLKKFLNRKGIICWGIVPTQEFSDKITSRSLQEKINTGLEALKKKGVVEKELLSGLLVSPSCGLGSLDASKAGPIFKLLSEVSDLMVK